VDRSAAAEHDVKASAPAVARMGRPNRGDPTRVTRGRQPIMHRRPDLAALDRWFAPRRVAGDEEDDAVPGIDGARESVVNGVPSPIERVAVKVDRAIGRGQSARKPLVPTAVERRIGEPWARNSRRRRGTRLGNAPSRFRDCWPRRRFGRSLGQRDAGKRADRRRHLFPQRLFLSAERSHGWPPSTAAGGALFRLTTCHRPVPRPRRPLPRTCRHGSHP